MAGGLSDYGASVWVASIFGVSPIPQNYYVALCTSEPGDAMDGDILTDIEPVDTAYRRQRYGVGAANWQVGAGFITNLNPLEFGIPHVDWGLITHYVLCTGPTSGDIFAWGEFLNPQYAQSASRQTIPAGGMVIAITALDSAISI